MPPPPQKNYDIHNANFRAHVCHKFPYWEIVCVEHCTMQEYNCRI